MPNLKRSDYSSSIPVFLLTVAVLVGAIYAVSYREIAPLSHELIKLPYYILRSLFRMGAAFALTLLIGIPYGLLATFSKRAGRVMLPLLDLMQSIPVLGYLPAAVLLFTGLFPGTIGRAFGLEIASVILIFTGMAWAVMFSVINGVRSIPADTKAAARSLGLTGFRYLRHVVFPAMYPPLVTGSLLAVGGGWYFLVAAEYITFGHHAYTLPGIGYFLAKVTYVDGNIPAALIGLVLLAATIYFINRYFWQPLFEYGVKYKFESVKGGAVDSAPIEELEGHPAVRLTRLVSSVSAAIVTPVAEFLEGNTPLKAVARFAGRHSRNAMKLVALVLLYLALTNFASIAGFISESSADLKNYPNVGGQYASVGEAILHNPALSASLFNDAVRFGALSMMRLVFAYFIALIIALLVGVMVAKSDRLFRFFMPVFDIAASVPALALFPIVVVVFIDTFGGSALAINLAAVVLLLTGMQWYLLFNVISAARSIPQEIKEAGRAFGLTESQMFSMVVLPAILQRLVFGSMEAFGGGWNSSIVAEYVNYSGKIYGTPGLGFMLDKATYEWASIPLVLITIAAMTSIILFMNRYIWKPLIGWTDKFKMES